VIEAGAKITPLVTAVAPELLALPGVGVETAREVFSRLLAAAPAAVPARPGSGQAG